MVRVTSWSSDNRSLARARAEYRSLKMRVPAHTRGRVGLLGALTFAAMVLVGGAGGAMLAVIGVVLMNHFELTGPARVATSALCLAVPLGCVLVALRGAKAAAVRIYERAARDVHEKETVPSAGVSGSSGVIVPGALRR